MKRALAGVLLSMVVFLNFGCAPSVVVSRQQERVVKPQSIQRDVFAYAEPSGTLDVVLVLDSAETGYVIEGLYYQLLKEIIESLRSELFRRVDYRLQVVTNPGRQTASVNLDRSENDCFLVSLFGSDDEGLRRCQVQNRLLDPRRPTRGALRSLTSAITGVSRLAVRPSGPSPTLFIFVQGSDTDPRSFSTDLADFGVAMRAVPTAKRYFTVIRKAPNSPACANGLGRMLAEAPTLETLARSVSSVEHFSTLNICEAFTFVNGGFNLNVGGLSAGISTRLAAISSHLWLSKQPYQPESMILQSFNTRFRYADDFVYDQGSGRVILSKPGKLRPGDPLEVMYFSSPPTDDLAGTPPPVPR